MPVLHLPRIFQNTERPTNKIKMKMKMKSGIRNRLSALAVALLLGAAAAAQADIIQVTANLTGSVTWRNTNEYVLTASSTC